MASDPVRVAVVGCGGIVNNHLRGWKALYEGGCRDFVVTACVDTVREAAEKRAAEIAEFQASRPGVFDDLDLVISSGAADAAVLCVPHWLHHVIGCRLLESGLHVLVEKPAGITIRATRRLIETARRGDRILAVAENVRRDLPARAWTWALRDQKAAGPIHFVLVQHLQHQPHDHAHPRFAWRLVRLLSGGGMILDSGAHFSDMMLVLFGKPEEVSCRMETVRSVPLPGLPVIGDAVSDVEDMWHAVIRFPDGPTVTWTFSQDLPGVKISNAVYLGERGTAGAAGFPLHPFQGGGELRLGDGNTLTNEQIIREFRNSLTPEQDQRLFPFGCTIGFGIEMYDFIRAIRTGTQPEIDGETGLKAKALSIACYESAAAGRPVRYQDVLEGKIDTYQRPIDEYWNLC